MLIEQGQPRPSICSSRSSSSNVSSSSSISSIATATGSSSNSNSNSNIRSGSAAAALQVQFQAPNIHGGQGRGVPPKAIGGLGSLPPAIPFTLVPVQDQVGVIDYSQSKGVKLYNKALASFCPKGED